MMDRDSRNAARALLLRKATAEDVLEAEVDRSADCY